MFDPVDPKQSLPNMELGILQYWKEEDIFKRSVHEREGSEDFSFYDGPPFATGLPHYGHLLAGTIKDVIPRYQTMKGKRVERRFGWDCHGLPVENLIEKEHGIKNHKEIKEMGVAKFNALCRDSVQRYTQEWRSIVERMGRWVDMDWDYRTMDPEYMESLWWAFKELYKKDLIYSGYKPMHICPRCATPLSNFEVTQGYAERTDLSVIITFPLIDDPKTILLAWTTTPWSLPGNTWLAIGKNIKYVKVKEGDITYVVAEKLVEKVFKGRDYKIVGSIDTKDIVGKYYEPLFPYFVNTVIPRTEKSGKPETYGERVFKVVCYEDVEVSDEDGTGIVHVTSCLGEDSYNVSVKEDVDVIHHVNIEGYFSPEVEDMQDIHVKPEGKDPMATDKIVIENLKKRGRHFSHASYTHSYPHCWRCDTPLLPYTTSSWFVSVEKIKEELIVNNKKTEWVPSHLRDGRFGKWLEGARDWAISRNRFWGTPIPIWRCEETGEIEVIGSRDDLMKRAPIRFSKLTAVRHGESEGNLVPMYQGKLPGTDLTDNGKSQIKELSKQFKDQKIDTIYCSPFARTKQTAEILAKASGAEVIEDDRLRELDFGKYEGETIDFSDLAFVKARRAKKLKEDSPESIFHFPGMETWEQAQERIDDFLKEVLPKHKSEHVLVITHADLIRNITHFMNKTDPMKLSHQPYPQVAQPHTFFWDHLNNAQMDLHKHNTDDITWSDSDEEGVEIVFVRHGETYENTKRIIQGHSQNELNDKGKSQAEETAKKLKNEKLDAVVTSDLKRCVQSAEIITKKLGIKIDQEMPELRERKFGKLEGKTIKELAPDKEMPTDGKSAVLIIKDINPPGGETWEEFTKRVKTGVKKLKKKYKGKRILVVGHGGTLRVLQGIFKGEITTEQSENAGVNIFNTSPQYKRIPEVFDCWFESGSMPYAQPHYPFENGGKVPPGFPADFIAEGMDQTRGWFYTLMILSTALFDEPPFHNCVVNGIVLAEDGKKMSKSLNNYPDPMLLTEKYGADAVRFTLMSSPAVRGEDLRFSEKMVAESMRNVLLKLWNSYSFFVTYANAAKFDPTGTRKESKHPLDVWIKAEVQDLANKMTEQLDKYELSYTCSELDDTIDSLTNWYIRLSRRRFAGPGNRDCRGRQGEDQLAALETMYEVLLTLSQLIAPFCPYLADAIYLNLVPEDHGSVHLTDWPNIKKLDKDEKELLERSRVMRLIVSLGHKVRSEKNIKVRQPLHKAKIALPPSMPELSKENLALLRQELNVKELAFADDPKELADVIVKVDARKVGPRLGKRVQEVIAAGKNGNYTINDDGTILILEEKLTPEEAEVVYIGKEGLDAAADKGVVVSVDTDVSDDLKSEGQARDLIRTVQRFRKEAGLTFTDQIQLKIEGADKVLKSHGDLIAEETRSTYGSVKGKGETVDLDGEKVTIRFAKTST
ncbi:MAG: class I tRNA ligase family protein [Candidatus Peribacteraceae bacterium]|jgi:isoleucyl-tRNA synthetase/bisphosphoglycerate-dependent phosphoglycerate mutase|nr:class I tRNA ligase family protein [Candidatus Peribacteraceae bacterium]